MSNFFSRLYKKMVPNASDLLAFATLLEGVILGYLVGSRTSFTGTAELIGLSALASLCVLSFVGYLDSRPGSKELFKTACRAARFNIKTYLWNTRYYFVLVAFAFLLAVLIGLIASAASPGYFESGYSFTRSQLGGVDKSNEFNTMIGLFTNNARAAMMFSILGSLSCGLSTFWGNTLNGTIFGIVMYKCISYYGFTQGVAVFFISVVPHGIIELPAIFLSGALAIRVAWGMLQAKMHKMRYGFNRLVENVVKVCVVYAVVVIPMLFVAAFIESYITTYLIRVLL